MDMDVAATMAAEPYLTHAPTLTGGRPGAGGALLSRSFCRSLAWGRTSKAVIAHRWAEPRSASGARWLYALPDPDCRTSNSDYSAALSQSAVAEPPLLSVNRDLPRCKDLRRGLFVGATISPRQLLSCAPGRRLFAVTPFTQAPIGDGPARF